MWGQIEIGEFGGRDIGQEEVVIFKVVGNVGLG